MKRLWAPWRMDYIQGDAPPDGCVFCLRDRGTEDEERLVLWRGEQNLVLMNKFPYSNGHLLIAPYRHTANLAALTEDEAHEMHRLLVLSQMVLQECCHPQGYNIGMNLGQIAGAGITDHLHLHIVPRWNGDTNFMPVFADVRVIPQHLRTTYELLAPAFARRRP
jgi:ATP adenylyltransferase